jgi:hypothetical protein
VDSDLYRGPIAESGPAELAGGGGYREVRTADPAGTTLTAVAFSRVRTIGLIREPLCYALVITLPADSAVTEADAAEILASFRFR